MIIQGNPLYRLDISSYLTESCLGVAMRAAFLLYLYIGRVLYTAFLQDLVSIENRAHLADNSKQFLSVSNQAII